MRKNVFPINRYKPRTGKRRQHGSILITTAVALFLIATVLGGAELGYLFYMKREFQKAADLAALAGAQRFAPQPGIDACTAATAAATQNAAENLPGIPATRIVCGRWHPSLTSTDHFDEFAEKTSHNALRVTISQDSPALIPVLFTGNRTIGVTAIAALDSPVANFSVGSQLLRTNTNSALASILRGMGVDPSHLTVLDSEGLANVKISPSGFLKSLGVDINLTTGVLTPENLAAVRDLSLNEIFSASLSAVAQNNALSSQLSLLANDLMRIGLSGMKISVLGSDALQGLLTLQTPNQSNESALNSEVDLGTLLKTSLSIAAAGRGVTIPSLSVAGLVNVQAGIVEPASIGIGGIGTQAYNAQIRLYVDVDSDALLGGALKPLISGLLGTRVHLPIYIDLVNGVGKLTDIDCLASPRKATIQVDSSVLRACVGRVDDVGTRFSTRNLCEDSLQPENLLRVLNVSAPAASIQLDGLSQTESLTLEEGATYTTAPNSLLVGNLVSELVSELTNVLEKVLGTPSTLNEDTKSLAKSYLEKNKKSNGLYDVPATISLLKSGDNSIKSPAFGDWNRTVTVPDSILGLSTTQKSLSVWTVLDDQTKASGGLLGILGLGQTCAGLLQALAWNNCVIGKVAEALNSAPAEVFPRNPAGGSGWIYALLSPLVTLLQPILNGVGSLLSSTLVSALGIELGRTDVKLNEVQCSRSKLVF